MKLKNLSTHAILILLEAENFLAAKDWIHHIKIAALQIILSGLKIPEEILLCFDHLAAGFFWQEFFSCYQK